MTKRCLAFGIFMLAMGLWNMPLSFAAPEQGPAQAGEQATSPSPVAAQAVHTAEFSDAQGNAVKVVTFSDGSVAASINGGPLVIGADAMQTLAAHGISISVAPSGQITGVTTSAGATVTQAARAVTPAEAASVAQGATPQGEAVSQTPAPVLSVLPANVATGSGMQSQQRAAEMQPSTPATGTPNSK